MTVKSVMQYGWMGNERGGMRFAFGIENEEAG